jgi:hypothetical protein
MAQTGAPRIVNTRTPEEWAERIRGKWQDNVKGIFAVGLELHNAREELGTAEFWKMTHERLRYADSTVRQLIQIGTSASLLSVDMSTLPAAWGTLYALARLTDEEFEQGIESGIIHAGMERKDVRLLKPPKEETVPPPPRTGQDLIEHLTIETRRGIVTIMRQLSTEEQNQYLSLVRLQLDDIEERRRQAT